VGHALEKLSGFELRHGEAVSIGMVAAARIAAQLGLADPSLAGRIAQTLAAWNLPTRCPPFDVAAISAAMTHDKKRHGKTLRWALPHAIGKVVVSDDVPPQIIQSALQATGARS
jgi:3-dehydroquinate synthetase